MFEQSFFITQNKISISKSLKRIYFFFKSEFLSQKDLVTSFWFPNDMGRARSLFILQDDEMAGMDADRFAPDQFNCSVRQMTWTLALWPAQKFEQESGSQMVCTSLIMSSQRITFSHALLENYSSGQLLSGMRCTKYDICFCFLSLVCASCCIWALGSQSYPNMSKVWCRGTF